MGYFLLSLLMLCGMFLMGVILIQRGRGGGLAGAFGGLGGQSAFGTKADDVFTVITVVTAVIWVILACVAGQVLRNEAAPSSYYKTGSSGVSDVDVFPGDKGADKKKDSGKPSDGLEGLFNEEKTDEDAGKAPTGKAA